VRLTFEVLRLMMPADWQFATQAADLWAEGKRGGHPCAANLIIAATALETGSVVVTGNNGSLCLDRRACRRVFRFSAGDHPVRKKQRCRVTTNPKQLYCTYTNAFNPNRNCCRAYWSKMITASRAINSIIEMGITHVVWVPDSLLGSWETELNRLPTPLIRVCREGEAWPLAAGLFAGGAHPLIMMQTTGLFESGDALRNVVYDLKVPVYCWIGVRNWLNPNSPDSARRFALPIVNAWQLEHCWVETDDDFTAMREHYLQCRASEKAGVALIAEGAG
jgi:sulfopyruvate decarboxylase subunit alpha